MPIDDDEIEKALDYLRDNSDAAAQASANRAYLTEYRKVLKAQLMKESKSDALAAQERDAYAHPNYIDFLAGLKEAVYQDMRHKFLLEAASAKIDAWRTEQSTQRAMGKIV